MNCLTVMISALYWKKTGEAFNLENNMPGVKHGGGSVRLFRSFAVKGKGLGFFRKWMGS